MASLRRSLPMARCPDLAQPDPGHQDLHRLRRALPGAQKKEAHPGRWAFFPSRGGVTDLDYCYCDTLPQPPDWIEIRTSLERD